MLLAEVSLKAVSSSQTDTLTRGELIERLNFIYLRLYPEGFSDNEEENARYKSYLHQLNEQQIERVPETTRLLAMREFKKAIRGEDQNNRDPLG